MSNEETQMKIRVPNKLKERIEESAKKNNRSMNAEIVQRLDMSFLNEIPANKIISAKDAIQIANKSKDELSAVIFKKNIC